MCFFTCKKSYLEAYACVSGAGGTRTLCKGEIMASLGRTGGGGGSQGVFRPDKVKGTMAPVVEELKTYGFSPLEIHSEACSACSNEKIMKLKTGQCMYMYTNTRREKKGKISQGYFQGPRKRRNRPRMPLHTQEPRTNRSKISP